MERESTAKAVTLSDMLAAREARAAIQHELRRAFAAPVVCLTMNIAGPVKATGDILRGHMAGVRMVEGQLLAGGWRVLARRETREHTGFDTFWAVACADTLSLKRRLCAIEDGSAFGRLLDIDLTDADGARLSRTDIALSPRKCLLCGKEAALCGRSRAHTTEELQAVTRRILSDHLNEQFAQDASDAAQRALLTELAATPKPGLVDRRNAGAHADMDCFTFLNSAVALRPYFTRCAEAGIGEAGGIGAIFPALRRLGMLCEGDMLRVTGGVNTHKGAIFTLGILCGAAGWLHGRGLPLRAQNVLAAAGDMTRQALEREPRAGARLQAASGYPAVRDIALPTLLSALASGDSLNDACLRALMALTAQGIDENIRRRGGEVGAAWARQAAADWLAHGDVSALDGLDAQFIARNLSPGGCADLLAAALFCHFLCGEYEGEADDGWGCLKM